MGEEECQRIAAVRRVVRHSQLMVWCRAQPSEIEQAARLKVDWVDISMPVSSQMLAHKLGLTRIAAAERLDGVVRRAQQLGLRVCLGCEDASRASDEELALVARQAGELGIQRLRYADTLGILDPFSTHAHIQALRRHWHGQLEIHAHDDLGLATANTLAALDLGVWNFQSSVAGLGGCPYAKGATGNVATEDVIYLLAGLEKFIHTDNTALQKFILFLLMAIAMTVIELIAGEIFIVKMHVKLWDYTGNKFNYKGIICPLYSLIWAALGAVYYFFIHPYILDALNWLANNLAFSFFIGFFYGVFAIDLFYSLKLAEKIKTFAEENDMVIRYEEFKRHIRESSEERKEKYRFMLSMGSGARLGEHLKKYRDKQREEQRGYRLNDFISKIKKSDT